VIIFSIKHILEEEMLEIVTIEMMMILPIKYDII